MSVCISALLLPAGIARSCPVHDSTRFGILIETGGGYLATIPGADAAPRHLPFLNLELKPGVKRSLSRLWNFSTGVDLRWAGYHGAHRELNVSGEGECAAKWSRGTLRLRGEAGYFSGPQTFDPSNPLDYSSMSLSAEHEWKRRTPVALMYSSEVMFAGVGRTDVRHSVRIRTTWQPRPEVVPRLRMGFSRNSSSVSYVEYSEISFAPGISVAAGTGAMVMTMMYLAYRRYDDPPPIMSGPGRSPGNTPESMGARPVFALFLLMWSRELTDGLDLAATYEFSALGSSAESRFSHRVGLSLSRTLGTL